MGREREDARERKRRQLQRKAMGASVALCDARTRGGTPCRLPAGFGTDHVGSGRCSRHGGSTATHRGKAAREQALAEVQAVALGGEVEVSPEDALEAVIHVAAANLSHWQARLTALGDAVSLQEVSVLYAFQVDAVDRVGRSAKAALDADLARRRAVLARRAGEALADVFEDALSHAPSLSRHERAAVLRTYIDGIERLERTPARAVDDESD
jgi:hypothetical protein